MEQPVVGIVMGSDSDWPLVQKACETLASFGVAYETPNDAKVSHALCTSGQTASDHITMPTTR